MHPVPVFTGVVIVTVYDNRTDRLNAFLENEDRQLTLGNILPAFFRGGIEAVSFYTREFLSDSRNGLVVRELERVCAWPQKHFAFQAAFMLEAGESGSLLTMVSIFTWLKEVNPALFEEAALKQPDTYAAKLSMLVAERGERDQDLTLRVRMVESFVKAFPLTARVETLEDSVKKLEDTVEYLKVEVTLQSHEISRLTMIVDKQNDTIIALTAKVIDQNEIIVALKAEITAQNDRMAALEREIAQLKRNC